MVGIGGESAPDLSQATPAPHFCAMGRCNLTCKPSWSQSPCHLRGPSSSPRTGPSAGLGGVQGPGTQGADPKQWPSCPEPHLNLLMAWGTPCGCLHRKHSEPCPGVSPSQGSTVGQGGWLGKNWGWGIPESADQNPGSFYLLRFITDVCACVCICVFCVHIYTHVYATFGCAVPHVLCMFMYMEGRCTWHLHACAYM